jgi:hypothetical protein
VVRELRERKAGVDRGAGVLVQPPWCLAVRIHHALADDGAKAHGLERFEHRIRLMHGLHRQHGGGAAKEQFRGREARARLERTGIMRGLHRPDALLEPVEQREVVRVAAEERLAEMNVRVDEAREDVAAAGIDDARGGTVAKVADGCDSAVLDQDIALDDVEGGVHCEDRAVTNEQGHSAWAST